MHIRLMIRKYGWQLLLPLLAGCSAGTATVTPTQVDLIALKTEIAGTVVESMTQTAVWQPTETIPPTQTAMPTATPWPTENPGVPLSLETLRMVYVKDGNLYIQNGSKAPAQLTRSGKDRAPIFSDDGQKLVFYRGYASDNVYSINADGTDEKLIVDSESLPVFGQGYVEFLTFRPSTHEVFFSTFLCESENTMYSYIFNYCTVSIFLVDADTGYVMTLVNALHGDVGQGRNFEISPDGRFLSVAASGHIDIVYNIFNGRPDFFKDQLNFKRTIPNEYLPVQYWLPDSSGFIAVLPDDNFNEPATPPHAYTVWRASPRDTNVQQIPLTHPIEFNSGCNFSVSPDGNWIFYNSNNEGIPASYLGNLNTGSAQLYDDVSCPSTYESSPKWSPDSHYFATKYLSGESIIGAVDGPPISIEGEFIQWIDASHYFYTLKEKDIFNTYIGNLGGTPIKIADDFVLFTSVVLTAKAK